MIYSTNYLQNSLNTRNINNSLFFILSSKYKKQKKNIFKTVITLRGYYIDKVIKDIIYIGSIGFNKDFFIKKLEHQDPLQHSNKKKRLKFVSKLINVYPTWVNLKYHPDRFKKKFLKKFLKKQRILFKINAKFTNNNLIFKKKLLKTNWTAERFFTLDKKKKISSILYNTKNIKIKQKWNKLNCLTFYGQKIVRRPEGFMRTVYTSLVFILPVYIKKAFRGNIVLTKLILSLYLKIFSKKKYNKNLMFKIILYFSLRNFFNFVVIRYLVIEDLRLRRSNAGLKRFLTIFVLNFRRRYTHVISSFHTKLYFKILSNNLHYSWIDILFFNKSAINYFLFDKDYNILSPVEKHFIRTIDKPKILKYLLLILFLNVKNFNDLNIYDNRFKRYFSLKYLIFFYNFTKLTKTNFFFTSFLIHFVYNNLYFKDDVKLKRQFNIKFYNINRHLKWYHKNKIRHRFSPNKKAAICLLYIMNLKKHNFIYKDIIAKKKDITIKRKEKIFKKKSIFVKRKNFN